MRPDASHCIYTLLVLREDDENAQHNVPFLQREPAISDPPPLQSPVKQKPTATNRLKVEPPIGMYPAYLLPDRDFNPNLNMQIHMQIVWINGPHHGVTHWAN